MKRRENNKKFIILLLVFLISVGFAYLSSTLNITGLTRVMGNNWNIYFDNIQYVRGQDFEITAPTTSGTTTTSVSYEVFLPSPGDVYKFNIDIVNAGSLDAMVKVVTDTELTEAQKKYASYYVTYNDGISCDDYQLLPKNSTDTLSVMVAYNRDILEEDLPDTDKSITVTFHLEFEQATSKATARNHITVVNRVNNNTLSVGDEIALGTEHFIIMNINNEKTTLLTKYDLNSGPSTLSDMTAGLQMTQNRDSSSGMPVSSFSTYRYWIQNNQLKSKYGTSYPAYVVDEEYNQETGNYFSTYYYVEQYIGLLRDRNMMIEKGRLMSLEDAISLGCTPTNDGKYSSIFFMVSKFILARYSYR